MCHLLFIFVEVGKLESGGSEFILLYRWGGGGVMERWRGGIQDGEREGH